MFHQAHADQAPLVQNGSFVMMKQREDQERRSLALEGKGSIWGTITCEEEDQAQCHMDGYHSGGTCVQSHRARHRGDHMIRAHDNKV